MAELCSAITRFEDSDLEQQLPPPERAMENETRKSRLATFALRLIAATTVVCVVVCLTVILANRNAIQSYLDSRRAVLAQGTQFASQRTTSSIRQALSVTDPVPAPAYGPIPLVAGDRFPDMTLEEIGGGNIRLANLWRKTPVIIEFSSFT
jgi:hypothetical protein